MPYNEGLAQRVRAALAAHAAVDEKKMFGGLAFMSTAICAAGLSAMS